MITIVSELPRPGTSLMMQMLTAGGMPILSDGERQLTRKIREAISSGNASSSFRKTPACIGEGEGKAVKVIWRLLLALPEGHA